MSTRANIIVKDDSDQLFFYRHSDGYPEGAMPILNHFMKWLKEGNIRNNTQQCAGWLIVLGAMEYNNIPSFNKSAPWREGAKEYGDTDTIQTPEDWKVGAIEPTTGIHGDIEFLYVIDLQSKSLKCYDTWTEEGEGKHEVKIPTKLLVA